MSSDGFQREWGSFGELRDETLILLSRINDLRILQRHTRERLHKLRLSPGENRDEIIREEDFFKLVGQEARRLEDQIVSSQLSLD